MTSNNTALLIDDLQGVMRDFTALLHEESNVIRTANFAHFIAVQDRKISTHARLNRLVEIIKHAPKTEEQKEQIRQLVRTLSPVLDENKRALETGFGAIERLVKRVVSVMRQALQKDTPRYTAGGAYHHSRKQTLTLQTDTKA